MQYADMLELPVNTCHVTLKPKKRRFFKKKTKSRQKDAKEILINKINNEENDVNQEQDQVLPLELENDGEKESQENPTVNIKQKQKKKFSVKISGTAIAFVIMGALLAVIILTNAFYPSGINAFMNSVFGSNTQTAVTDDRTYQDFAPILNFNGQFVEDENGLINFSGEGSIYSVADGTVLSCTENENGKFDIQIAHSDNFISVFNGVDYSYVKEGDAVYSNIPLGFVRENTSLCFLNGDSAITNFDLTDNAVIWAE